VARRHPVDLQKIELWSIQEKQLAKLREFYTQLLP
jgi:hypothetical protein